MIEAFIDPMVFRDGLAPQNALIIVSLGKSSMSGVETWETD